MKTFLIAALAAALSGPATAGVIASLGNGAGGQIKLTDEACKNTERPGKVWRFAYSTVPGGQFVTACWQATDEEILVIYDDGNYRLYPISAFTLRRKSQGDRPEKPRYRRNDM